MPIFDGCGEQVGLNSVLYEGEVAASFAVAVDKDHLAFEQRGHPFRDHGGISPIRVLSRSKHIEVTQANGVKTVAL